MDNPSETDQPRLGAGSRESRAGSNDASAASSSIVGSLSCRHKEADQISDFHH